MKKTKKKSEGPNQDSSGDETTKPSNDISPVDDEECSSAGSPQLRQLGRVLRTSKANSCELDMDIQSLDSESLYSPGQERRLARRSLSASQRGSSRSQSAPRIWNTPQEESPAIAIPKVVRATHALKNPINTFAKRRNSEQPTQETPVVLTRYKHKKGLSRKSAQARTVRIASLSKGDNHEFATTRGRYSEALNTKLQ